LTQSPKSAAQLARHNHNLKMD